MANGKGEALPVPFLKTEIIFKFLENINDMSTK